MNVRAGVVTAAVGSVALSPWVYQRGSVKEVLAGTALAAVCSALPDLDHNRSTMGHVVGPGATGIRWIFGGHRMGTHSLLFVALCWLAVWWEGTTVGPIHSVPAVVHTVALMAWWHHSIPMSIALANGGAIGVLSHIWCDLWTKMGVGLLWPLTRRRFRLGNMTTGERGESIYIGLVMCVGILVGALYLDLIYSQGGIPWAPSSATQATPARSR